MARKKKSAQPAEAEIPVFDAGSNAASDPTGQGKITQPGPMAQDEFEAIINRVFQDGANFVDTELSPQRAIATDYYMGQPFGNEEDGRSSVVLPELRAVIAGLLPGMVEMFFSPDRVLEFVPTSADTVEVAEQATEYIHTTFMEECDGFKHSLNVMKDGLIRRIGIFKWWWDDTDTERNFSVKHCTDEEIQALLQDPDVTLLRQELEEGTYDAPQQPPPPPPPPPQPGQPPQPPQAPPPPPKLYTVEFKCKYAEGRLRVSSVPPDEFLFSREARDIGDSTREMLFCGHRRELTTGELLDMGVTQEELDEHGGNDTMQITQQERVARAIVQNFNGTREQQAGDANMKHIFVEGFIHVDFNGDGKAELRRVCTLGPTFWPIPSMNKPVDERPFAVYVDDPEPHELLGLSEHDKVEMPMRVKSMLLRAGLDNVSQVVTPRLKYVEGEVAPGDAMNQANGAPLRVKSLQSAEYLMTPFVGDSVQAMMGVMDDHIERQTGMNKGVKQVDADALQSSTPEAVDKAVMSAEAIQQLKCRIFAEYTLKRVFRGMYGLLAKHQPRGRMVKMRGKYVEMNPTNWPTTLGMRVNVAIGQANRQEKIEVMKALYDQQTAVASQFGPDNPIYPLPKISATAERILRLSGIEDVDTYMNVLPPDFQMPPAPPPPPSPEEIQANAMAEQEKAKTLRELAIKKDELALQEKKANQDYDLKLREMAMNFTLKRYAIDAQFKANYTEAQLEQDARQAEAFLKSTTDMMTASTSAAQAAHGMAMDQKKHALDAAVAAHGMMMDQTDQNQEDAAAAADDSAEGDGE